MNVPGRTGGNWRWRLGPGQLGAREAERLRGHDPGGRSRGVGR